MWKIRKKGRRLKATSLKRRGNYLLHYWKKLFFIIFSQSLVIEGNYIYSFSPNKLLLGEKFPKLIAKLLQSFLYS